VLGAGVAGLAAVQAARGLGAVVHAYDVRPAARDQVESMGGQFLAVGFREDGSGSGGYAKEMSAGYKAAERELMLQATREADVVITTALIPGKPAPRLVRGLLKGAPFSFSLFLSLSLSLPDKTTGLLPGAFLRLPSSFSIHPLLPNP
jgi:threonine dehydrogenase-like Zn-dependent dehydrogenase